MTSTHGLHFGTAEVEAAFLIVGCVDIHGDNYEKRKKD
jgi:hypothetical protein